MPLATAQSKNIKKDVAEMAVSRPDITSEVVEAAGEVGGNALANSLEVQSLEIVEDIDGEDVANASGCAKEVADIFCGDCSIS